MRRRGNDLVYELQGMEISERELTSRLAKLVSIFGPKFSSLFLDRVDGVTDADLQRLDSILRDAGLLIRLRRGDGDKAVPIASKSSLKR